LITVVVTHVGSPADIGFRSASIRTRTPSTVREAAWTVGSTVTGCPDGSTGGPGVAAGEAIGDGRVDALADALTGGLSGAGSRSTEQPKSAKRMTVSPIRARTGLGRVVTPSGGGS
jgi:hypothetical protein